MENNKFEISATLACIAAFITAKFGFCGWLVLVLLVFMALDFVTGLTAAGLKGNVSSQAGWTGAIKKTMFMALVAVGAGCDWIISNALPAVGVDFGTKGLFASLIMIWLLSVELISIVENCDEMGVPIPPFLLKVIGAIKSTAEKAGDSASVKGGV